MNQLDELTIGLAINRASSITDIAFKVAPADSIREAFSHYFQLDIRRDLSDLYDAGLERIGDEISGYPVLTPGRNSKVTGERELIEADLVEFRKSAICPILSDGCGNYHAVYLKGGDNCVYFFDSMISFSVPRWGSASSIPRLIVAAASAAQSDDGWPSEPAEALEIDPYLFGCKRAPPIWLADG